MQGNSLIEGIAALGLGSGIGTVVTAIVASRAQKGKARAEAADLLVNAAERVGKMNESMDSEIRRLKATIDGIQVSMMEYLAEEISREELLNRIKELRK